ncbi:MAG: helix-turn-helix transcriptional regulator [Clostridia bacterium]|nr:helix-turn-helix transcriptional regulator [Clostridia bacterium]
MEINIGKTIKELRLQCGLSQTTLASMLNTTQDSISLWELGKSWPDIEIVVKLAKIFGVSTDYLLGLEK